MEDAHISAGDEHTESEDERFKAREPHSSSTEPLWTYEGTREASLIDPPMSDRFLRV